MRVGKLQKLIDRLRKLEFKDSKGESLMKNKEFNEIVEMVSRAYMHGQISVYKKLAVVRDGKKVVGVDMKPLAEIIQELEKFYGIDYVPEYKKPIISR